MDEFTLFTRILCVYLTIVLIVSIVGYGVFFADSVYFQEGANRLHGVYGQPAQLAFSSTLNMGLAWIAFRNAPLRLAILALSITCLVLTGVRTFAAAVVVGLAAVVILHGSIPRYAKLAVCAGLGFLLVVLALSGAAETLLRSHNRYLRSESLTNFTGRTTLWKRAIPVALSKPFGSGFCLGGGALLEDPDGSKIVIRAGEDFDPLTHSSTYKSTLHNGYVQSLTDLGILGFLTYCLLFLRGLLATFASRNRTHFSALIFIFYVIATGNMAESIVMSPTSTSSAMFWLVWFLLIRNEGEGSLLDRGILPHGAAPLSRAARLPV
ncbi:MAG: O-antigen ligase family protein [Syntrophobacteraceae bacterium]